MINKILLIFFSLSYLLAGCKAQLTDHLEKSENEDMFQEIIEDNPPKNRHVKTIHDNGHYTTVCWTEITTIKENSLNGSLQAMKEYSIKFQSPHEISEEQTEKINYGETKQYEVFDLNTKKSKVLNFTKVEEENGIVTSQHRQVTCGSGPVFTKTLKQSANNKEVEIKVMPKSSSDTPQALIRSLTVTTPSNWVEVESYVSPSPGNYKYDTPETTPIPIFSDERKISDMSPGESRNIDISESEETTVTTEVPLNPRNLEESMELTTPLTILIGDPAHRHPCKDVQCISELQDVLSREDKKENEDPAEEENVEEKEEQSEDETEEEEEEETKKVKESGRAIERKIDSGHSSYRYPIYIKPNTRYVSDSRANFKDIRDRDNKKKYMIRPESDEEDNEFSVRDRDNKKKYMIRPDSDEEDNDFSSSVEEYRYLPYQRQNRFHSRSENGLYKPYPLVRIKLRPDDIEDITRLLTRKLYDDQIGIFELYDKPSSEEKVCPTCLPLGYKFTAAPLGLRSIPHQRRIEARKMYDVINETQIPENSESSSSVVEEEEEEEENGSADEREEIDKNQSEERSSEELQKGRSDVENPDVSGTTVEPSTTPVTTARRNEAPENEESSEENADSNEESSEEDSESADIEDYLQRNNVAERSNTTPYPTTEKEAEEQEKNEAAEEPKERQIGPEQPEEEEKEEEQECICKPKKAARKVRLPFTVHKNLPPETSETPQQISPNSRNLSPYYRVPSNIYPSLYNSYQGGFQKKAPADSDMMNAMKKLFNEQPIPRYQYVDKNYDVNPIGSIKSRKMPRKENDDLIESLSSLLENVMAKLI